MTSIEENAQQLYKNVIENLSDPLYVINDKFEILLMNGALKKWLRELGINTNLIGVSIFEAFSFLPQKIFDEYDYVLREGISLFTEEETSISNEIINVIVSKVPIIRDGKVVHIITILRDITRRKKVEKKLKESELKYRNLLDNLDVGFFQVTLDGHMLHSNRAHNVILGYDPSESLKDKDVRFFWQNPEDRDEYLRYLLKHNFAKDYTCHALKKNGEKIVVELNSHLIRDEKGDPIRIDGTFIDITEKYNLGQKLKESEHQLRERIKELNCLYGISKIAERSNISYEELISETLNLIPVAWQFPKITCARIYYDGNEFKSENFKETKWKLTTHIDINKKQMDIDVFYLESKPFLSEEENIIIEIGKRLKNLIEKKESKQKLEESEEKYRRIFETIPDLFFLVSGDSTILDFKGNIEDLYLQPEEFLGKKIIDIAPENVAKLSLNSIKKTLETQKPQIIEYNLDINGVNSFFEARNLYYSNDRVLIFVRDITERKYTEEALLLSEKNYREAYDQANFYKDLFAHDISNILQVINSSAELISYHLGESEKSKDIKNVSDIIKRQVERGSKLVSNVRTLSELEEEEISIKPTKICNSLKKSIEFIKKAYTDREVNILVDSIKKEYSINANELLQDIFENILINGIKYNDDSKVDILIKISNQKIDNINYLKMEFIDNGIGVPDNKKNIIFKRGNRELKGSKGMGLGLSLVSKILNSFNGKIWVEDRVKGDHTKGSNFIILLPEIR